jgi:hypothetical protein
MRPTRKALLGALLNLFRYQNDCRAQSVNGALAAHRVATDLNAERPV